MFIFDMTIKMFFIVELSSTVENRTYMVFFHRIDWSSFTTLTFIDSNLPIQQLQQEMPTQKKFENIFSEKYSSTRIKKKKRIIYQIIFMREMNYKCQIIVL